MSNLKQTVVGPTIALTLCLVGCSTLAPTYERPEAPIATDWPTADRSAGTDQGVKTADIAWRSFIADVTLQGLIETALENNRDLRVAALNIEKARAQYRIQRSELLPSVGLSASETAQRTARTLSMTGSPVTSRVYSIGLGVSAFELDFFGRVRSLRDRALQEFLSTEEARRSAYLSLISEVTTGYMNWIGDLAQLKLAEDTVESREKSYRLQLDHRRLGSTSDLTVRQAQAELEVAKLQAQSFKMAVQLDRNALELLIGKPLPADFKPTASLDSVLTAKEIPAGLPSDLLQDRPDILAAEHHLIGMNANIGAARAAFFPSVTLTASAGRASNSLSDLFSGGGGTWSFIPQINLPIFTAGRLQADLDAAKVDREIAVAQYEKSIQAAFREVADALASRSVIAEQLDIARRRTEAAQAAHDLVQIQYKMGATSYLEALDAQRTLYAAQQGELNVRLSHRINLIGLYKALGGGGNEVKMKLADSSSQGGNS